MPKRSSFVRYSADAAKKLNSEADWTKVAATTREEIERQALVDEGPLPVGWENTVVVGVPETRQSVTMLIDASVLRWFKAHGPGYQARMNAVLRAFVTARRREEETAAAAE